MLSCTVTLDDLAIANEVFLTSSAGGILPVAEVDGVEASQQCWSCDDPAS